MNSDNQYFRVFVSAILVILFLISGFLIVSYAAGYKIDFTNRQISQTGMIAVSVRVAQAEIFLDSKPVGKGSVTLRNLTPGNYSIRVAMDGYHDWTKNVSLDGQEAIFLSNIVLFTKNPKIEEYSSSVRQSIINDLSDTNGLSSQGGEIYANGRLVTRILGDVSGLCWYWDHQYIAFSANGKLQIIEIDGTNNIELLDHNDRTPVIFTNAGNSVIFENQNKIFKAQIR